MGTPTSLSTGELTPQTLVVASGKALLNSVSLQPTAVVTIYDNTAASGKIVFQFTNVGTSTVVVPFARAVRCDIGMTVVVATANAQVYHGAS
jgi:2-phospho-L-lactate transferase/gluconeogenesis factor (CofD/UPF0052 family)